ncbi:MAG: hypothetical protein ACI97K_001116 [Glaciecola sp.]|jgi:hypothetical protein
MTRSTKNSLATKLLSSSVFATKLLVSAMLASTILTSIVALGLMSASAFAADNKVELSNDSAASVIVKGTEYQPNIVQQNGLHLKVKKRFTDAKLLSKLSSKLSSKSFNATKSLAVSVKKTLSREAARNDEDPDFWIYDSFVSLTADIDYDGYYSSFELEFDVDTVYESAPIYAVIYTATSDEFTPFYTTNIYNINGDNTRDAIIIENNLVTGFPSNDYELMIVIYDADTDEIVAVSDGTDDADLAFLSLESENFEYIEPVEVIVVEHGGAVGILLILGFGFAAYRRFIA